MGDIPLLLADLALNSQSSETIGGKARHLARLLAHGLPVPEGVVVPPGSACPHARDLAHLGPLLSVRSSSPVEDQDRFAAPGLFTSRVSVPCNDDAIAEAVAAVRGSARTEAAAAYARANGWKRAPEIAVIIHRYIDSDTVGTVYTRPPGAPEEDAVRIEIRAGERLFALRRPRATDDTALPHDCPLSSALLDAVVELSLRAEQAIGATGGADVEWVLDGEAPVLVQARPIIHRDSRVDDAPPPSLFAFSREQPEWTWHWDVTHNPDPLSPAQTALVEQANAVSPYPMVVVAGYLYSGSRTDAAASETAAPTAAELRTLFFDRILPEAERELERVEGEPAPSVGEALATYLAVFKLYAGDLSPALSAARRQLPERALFELPPMAESPTDRDWIAMAPAWDVAVPTYAERGVIPQSKGAAFPSAKAADDSLARAVRDIAELDDRLFYRAQWIVRRALLARAQELKLDDPADLFYCDTPLSPPTDPGTIAEQAERARARLEAARLWTMPLAFANGAAVAEPERAGRDCWTGEGTGGSVRGRVVKVMANGELAGDGDILVAPAVHPALVVTARGLRAVVSEHGGLLGHAAAMARELGIVCVVGCRRAWRDLTPEEEVIVDGDNGLVVRLGPSGPRSHPGDGSEPPPGD